MINRPIDDIWAFITDRFNMPRLGGDRLAIQYSPGPIGVGGTVRQRYVIFGVETMISGVVTEMDPPRAATRLQGTLVDRRPFLRRRWHAYIPNIKRLIEAEARA